MKNKARSNTPVYFFLGFKLLEGNYFRFNDKPMKSFGIKIIDSLFDTKSSIHVLSK